MRHIARILLSLALVMSLVLPIDADAGIFGRNDIRLPGIGDPVAAVGAIDCPDPAFRATGFFLSRGATVPPALVTAGHVLVDAAGSPRRGCRFFPGGRVDAAEWNAGWPVTLEAAGDVDPHQVDIGDWAVAHVEPPGGRIPASLTVEAASAAGLVARRDAGDRFLLIGYHQPMDRLMVSDRCGPVDLAGTGHAFEGEERIIVHDCDAILGWSGGPLIMMAPDGPVVVGFHYAGSTGNLPFAPLGVDTSVTFELDVFENHAHGFVSMPDLMAALPRSRAPTR